MSIDSTIIQNISIKFSLIFQLSEVAVYYIIIEFFQKMFEEIRTNIKMAVDDEREKLNQRQGIIFLFYYERNSVLVTHFKLN